MIVFKNNYKQIFPLFKESLEMCEFLSFDCEMTGVTMDLKTDATKYDTAQFRYYKFREIVKRYELIQVGITFYIRKEVEPKLKENEQIEEILESKESVSVKEQKIKVNDKFYLERTFTFFLFKNSKLRFLTDLYSYKHEDNIFASFTTCHPATLKFLNDNHFDLNSIVSGGINYNKLAYKDNIKQAVRQHIKEGKLPNSIVYLSKSNELKILDVMKKIAKFLTQGPEEEHASQVSVNKNKNKNASAQKTLKILDLNPFLINYILSVNFKKIFKIQNFNLCRDKTDKTGSTLIVEKSKSQLSTEEFIKAWESYDNFCHSLNMDMIVKAKYSHVLFSEGEEESIIDEELGFSKFIRTIIEHNMKNPTPIVGHNIFFDLLFIYDKFINDLPENFYEFKCEIHKHFPLIFDNKFLTTRLAKEFDNTKLDSLYRNIKKSKYDIYVDIKPDVVNGFSYYQDLESSNFHDAGFDSIITGRCFIYLLKAVENLFEVDVKKVKVDDKNKEGKLLKGFLDFNMRDRILYQFTNKTLLSMMDEPYDVLEFNLENESWEDFISKEERMIRSLFSYIFVIKLKRNEYTKNLFYSIYDFAKSFENNLFNLSIVKIDDHAAFVEFIPIDQNFQSDEDKIKQLIEVLKASKVINENIELMIHYKEFAKRYTEFIKF